MSKNDPLSQSLRSWVDVSTHHSMRGWHHHAKATGLSMPQFSILMMLYYRQRCGLSDISERFETTAAAASQHVDNLVQAGLIERAEDPNDRRAKQVQLSARGRDLIERGMGARYQWLNDLAADLDAGDRKRISQALDI